MLAAFYNNITLKRKLLKNKAIINSTMAVVPPLLTSSTSKLLTCSR